MTLRPIVVGAALVAAIGACDQQLTVPGQCPEFCPGGNSQVAEIVIPVTLDSDTTFVGYVGNLEVPALLVSEGIEPGEARAWYQFPSRPDTVLVDEWLPYTIDSVAFSFPMVGLDTLRDDLRLILHRVPITLDTTVTFEEMEALLTDESVVDTVALADTLRAGQVARFVLSGDVLSRLEFPADDSGFLGLGIRLVPGTGSGVRLGSLGGSAPPVWTTYARVEVSDTARQRQSLSFGADQNGYIMARPPITDPDALWLGGLPSARSVLRFELPLNIRDSALILRATLELVPASPFAGIPGDPGILQVRGVLRDLGGKSTPTFTAVGARELPSSGSETISVEVQSVVELWRGANGLPQMLYLNMLFDGGSFDRPLFRSTRSGMGAPQLRIDYLVPGRTEQP